MSSSYRPPVAAKHDHKQRIKRTKGGRCLASQVSYPVNAPEVIFDPSLLENDQHSTIGSKDFRPKEEASSAEKKNRQTLSPREVVRTYYYRLLLVELEALYGAFVPRYPHVFSSIHQFVKFFFAHLVTATEDLDTCLTFYRAAPSARVQKEPSHQSIAHDGSQQQSQRPQPQRRRRRMRHNDASNHSTTPPPSMSQYKFSVTGFTVPNQSNLQLELELSALQSQIASTDRLIDDFKAQIIHKRALLSQQQQLLSSSSSPNPPSTSKSQPQQSHFTPRKSLRPSLDSLSSSDAQALDKTKQPHTSASYKPTPAETKAIFGPLRPAATRTSGFRSTFGPHRRHGLRRIRPECPQPQSFVAHLLSRLGTLHTHRDHILFLLQHLEGDVKYAQNVRTLFTKGVDFNRLQPAPNTKKSQTDTHKKPPARGGGGGGVGVGVGGGGQNAKEMLRSIPPSNKAVPTHPPSSAIAPISAPSSQSDTFTQLLLTLPKTG